MLVERLNLPLRPEEHVIYKKQLAEQLDSNAKTRRLLDNIEKIRLTYILNQHYSGIPPYIDEVEDYQEVDILDVRLHSYASVRQIAALIGQAIPHPLVLFITSEGRTALALARTRINQNDNTRLTVADSLLLEDIAADSCAYSALGEMLPRSADIRALYYAYYDAMSSEQLRLYAGATAIRELSGEEARSIYAELVALDARLATIRRELKQDKNLNANVRRNMELVACKRKRREIIQKLEG